MQATVRSYDETARSGSVFTDDGTVMPFSADSLAGSGLRLLRPGQRVRLRLGEDGSVAALTLATFPLPPDPAPATGSGPAESTPAPGPAGPGRPRPRLNPTPQPRPAHLRTAHPRTA